MIRRILALAFIFCCSAVAWAVLGATIFARTYNSGPGLRQKVESSWGAPQQQFPPTATYLHPVNTKTKTTENGQTVEKITETMVPAEIPLESSKVDVSLNLEHRQKGLLWYSTYKVALTGNYVFRNDTGQPRNITFGWYFPAEKAIYDDLTLTLDGQPLPFKNEKTSIAATALFPPNSQAAIQVRYRSQGLDTWQYSFGSTVSEVRGFTLHVVTNFDEIDFPENTISPTEKRQTGTGWNLTWHYNNLVSGYNIGIAMPAKLQPGPLAGEISYFAPVSLFFFFFVMFIISTLRGLDLHAVHYMFLAAAFFAFHLLLAYLVDHISIHLAFIICSTVSIALVVSYLRLVVGIEFAAREAGIAQFIYLVLFSYAFFFKGFTGLAVTIGAILTLFVVMQATGRLNWTEQFRKVSAPAA